LAGVPSDVTGPSECTLPSSEDLSHDSEEFLYLAWKFARDHKARIVNHAQFRPILQEHGLSGAEIESLTAPGQVDGLWRTGEYFEITRPVFMDYVLRPCVRAR